MWFFSIYKKKEFYLDSTRDSNGNTWNSIQQWSQHSHQNTICPFNGHSINMSNEIFLGGSWVERAQRFILMLYIVIYSTKLLRFILIYCFFFIDLNNPQIKYMNYWYPKKNVCKICVIFIFPFFFSLFL